MPEFAGYKCDGPSCENTVNRKDSEARRWLQVSVANESFNQDFTFCSYDCFEQQVHETASSQHASFE